MACCFTVNCFSWGVVAVLGLLSVPLEKMLLISVKQSYGIYLSHYLKEGIFPGSTAVDFAFIGGFNFSMAMIVSPLVTILTRKYGKHLTMSIGVILQTTGYITASFSNRIWVLYLTQGFLVGFGIGFLYIPSTAILSQWFTHRRSLANGISSAGSGIGGACFAWATETIIEQLSVAWALRITGLVVFVANSGATIMIRDRNHDVRPPQLALDMKLLRRYDIWLLLLWTFTSMLGYIVLLFSLSDFALSIGLSNSQATNVVGLLNIGTAIGRSLIGIWSDKHSRIDVAAWLTLACGLCCFAFWLPASGYGLTLFFALISGAILGIFWVVSRFTYCSPLSLTFV